MLGTFFLVALAAPQSPLAKRPATVPNRPPRIEYELASEVRRAPIRPGDSVRVTVRAVDPEGGRVSLRALAPPPGVVFDAARSVPSPARVDVRWWVSDRAGPSSFERLEVVAEDERGGSARATIELPLQPWWTRQRDGIQLGDVTGDGVLDVVAAATAANAPGNPDAGAVYVWSGAGDAGGAPSATLRGSGTATRTIGLGSELALVDVTGDGGLDVVALSRAASRGAVPNVGAVLVWRGGPALVGEPAPAAVLQDPAGASGDLLHDLWFLDVDGDGRRDVVAGSERADGVRADEGALYVWRGGPALSGALAPAVKYLPTEDAEEGFALLAYGDVSGDGVLDLVGGRRSDLGARNEKFGGLYVWFGGADFAESPLPDATLVPPALSDANHCGDVPPLLADLTGDGVLDVVCGTPDVDAGALDVGALFVWVGGAELRGTRSASATLMPAAPSPYDRLGESFFRSGKPLKVGDVTGDGVLDVVVSACRADRSTLVPATRVADAGAVFVWAGRAELAGTLAPTAELFDPSARAGDQLTEAGASGEGFVLADVTGDGVADVVAAAALADVGARADEGKVLVWAGGAALSGRPAPRASLFGASAGASAGPLGGLGGLPPEIGDVTGDGVDDLVLGSRYGGVLAVWSGGPALLGAPLPLARLADPIVAGRGFSAGGRALFLGDVSGDGVADVVGGAMAASPSGRADAGAVLVWSGGAALAGAPAALARLVDPLGEAGDSLAGDGLVGQGLRLGDLDGDDSLDVVATADRADALGVDDCGALFAWRGGAALAGESAPARLARAAPQEGDLLGWARGHGLLLGDLGAAGGLDLVAGGAWLDAGATIDRGGILVWRGAELASGAPALELGVPTGAAGDRLGE